MKRKLLAALLCFSMLGAILTGCGKSNNTEKTDTTGKKEETNQGQKETNTPTPNTSEPAVTEPVNLTFIFADGDEGAKAVMNDIVNNFNNSQKDITIRIEPGHGGAYNEFLKTKDSVGEFPDIMEMRDTAVYVRAGKLAPLSEELKALFKTTIEFEGEIYTAPMAGENTQGIMYNKTYFEENNLQIPNTWDEFLNLCQTIKDKGDMAPLVVGGSDLWHMGFWFHKLYNDEVLQNDPDFIANAYGGTKDFTDQNFKNVFIKAQKLFEYVADGWASTPDAQITTFLVNDMAAMLYSGTHMFSQIKDADPDFDLGWFAIPDNNGKVNLVGGAGIGGLALSAEAAKDPNKQAAFDEFIKFFFSQEQYKKFCEQLSFLPTTVDAPDLDVSDVMLQVIDAINSADSLGQMWNGKVGNNELPPDFRNFTYKTLVEVIQGQRTLDSACDELNKTWGVSISSFNPVKGIQ